MKIVLFVICSLLSVCGYGQTKNKIIPIDNSILKLNEDITLKIKNHRSYFSVDYAIVVNKKTNKKDTIMIYRDFFIDKKRKSKN